MSYTNINFKSKKVLKDALAAGTTVTVYNPGLGGDLLYTFTGDVFFEGPHYPQPHKWYAKAIVVEGKIVKVK